MYSVEIEKTPRRRLVAMTHRGPYPEIGATYARLSDALAANGLIDRIQGMVAVYYDDVSKVAPHDLRSHAGFVVSGRMKFPEGTEELILKPGRCAVLHYRGPYYGMSAAYDYLFGQWLPASGETMKDAPCFEVYLNSPMDTAPEELLTEICVPLK